MSLLSEKHKWSSDSGGICGISAESNDWPWTRRNAALPALSLAHYSTVKRLADRHQSMLCVSIRKTINEVYGKSSTLIWATTEVITNLREYSFSHHLTNPRVRDPTADSRWKQERHSGKSHYFIVPALLNTFAQRRRRASTTIRFPYSSRAGQLHVIHQICIGSQDQHFLNNMQGDVSLLPTPPKAPGNLATCQMCSRINSMTD